MYAYQMEVWTASLALIRDFGAREVIIMHSHSEVLAS